MDVCCCSLFCALLQMIKVIIDDILTTAILFMSLLTTDNSLQHNFQTPAESGQVRLGQQRSHLVKEILGQRGSHDITDMILGQREELKTQPGGTTDSEGKEKKASTNKEL